MNKKIPVWFLLLVVWLMVCFTLFFGWSVWYINNGGDFFSARTRETVLTIAKFPTTVKESLQQLTKPTPLIIKDRYPDINGFELTDKNYVDKDYLLYSSYDTTTQHCTIKLMRLSDQKIMYDWKPDLDEIKKYRDENSRELDGKVNDIYKYTIKQNISLNYPLVQKDGSVIFATQRGPLTKYDKNSKLMWVLKGTFHHGIELDADENIWVNYEIPGSKFLPALLKNYQDEAIAKVSQDGKLLYVKSINEMLYENGYRGLLFGVGPLESDPVHLNDVQPALTSGPYWEKGDLLISLRNKSTVILYRPSTNKILWLKTGPWLYQHDADFIDDTRIGLFGNNVIRNANFDFIDKHNEFYVYDFKDNTLTTPYSEFLSKAKVSTRIGGQSQILENGDLFVEESVFGRLIRGNKEKTVWQFVNRIDKESSAMFFWSRILSPEEVSKFEFLKN